jgi:hypothetical protein
MHYSKTLQKPEHSKGGGNQADHEHESFHLNNSDKVLEVPSTDTIRVDASKRVRL